MTGLLRLPGVGRRRGPAPGPATTVLATTGGPFDVAAVRAAADRAEGGPVAVVAVARLHGFAFGMPNPGLLPTAAERQEQVDNIAAATRLLARRRVPHDDQIVVTRNAAKSIARIARQCGASLVILQVPLAGRGRRWVEGDPARALRRRLGPQVALEVHRSNGLLARP